MQPGVGRGRSGSSSVGSSTERSKRPTQLGVGSGRLGSGGRGGRSGGRSGGGGGVDRNLDRIDLVLQSRIGSGGSGSSISGRDSERSDLVLQLLDDRQVGLVHHDPVDGRFEIVDAGTVGNHIVTEGGHVTLRRGEARTLRSQVTCQLLHGSV